MVRQAIALLYLCRLSQQDRADKTLGKIQTKVNCAILCGYCPKEFCLLPIELHRAWVYNS
ncbi:MAG: hypothetical protein WBB82_17175 [Limnothrix sp.]